MASNFFADEDDDEEELPDAVRNGEEERVMFPIEEVAADRARHEAEDFEVRHDWEKRVRHGVGDDEARPQVDNDEGRHEWEERLRHELDDGQVMHKERDDHELELETVRHDEKEEEVEEEWDVIGITEEVLAFATNIARHPETWLDFPLLPDDDESDGPFSCFDMSNAQQEHALAIEQLAPRLAALRIELCPIHMSEECFWKIYFVLLHPRLNKQDAELLSTPQIVDARAMLMQCLQHQSKLETEQLYHRKDDFGMHSEEDTSKDIPEVFPSMLQQTASVIPITDFETEKHPIQVTEVAVVDKSVIKEQLTKDSKTPNVLQESFDDDIDDWFDEEAELAGHTTIPIGDEEDVSFSDLEDDDEK
uniref:BSD domain-containing protein n=2 Tax=Oryza brachyantha TaxID=4533 RepID=J3LSH2_ORYBR